MASALPLIGTSLLASAGTKLIGGLLGSQDSPPSPPPPAALPSVPQVLPEKSGTSPEAVASGEQERMRELKRRRASSTNLIGLSSPSSSRKTLLGE